MTWLVNRRKTANPSMKHQNANSIRMKLFIKAKHASKMFDSTAEAANTFDDQTTQFMQAAKDIFEKKA